MSTTQEDRSGAILEDKKGVEDSIDHEHKKILAMGGSEVYTFGSGDKGVDDTEASFHQGLVYNAGRDPKLTMRFETSLSTNYYQIKDIFSKICNKMGFELVDDEGDHLTAVGKRVITIAEFFKNCFTGKGMSCQETTAITLSSRTNKTTCKRRIMVKALYGNVRGIKEFFHALANELELLDRKSPDRKGTQPSFIQELNSPTTRSSRYIHLNDEDEAEADEQVMSAQNLESYSFYEFRKILSAEQYALGQKVSKFISNLQKIRLNNCLFLQFHLLENNPKLQKTFLVIHELTEHFFADFNYGKSETKKMMPYCRVSVEKYVFDKVYNHIFDMYKMRYADGCNNYNRRTKEILDNTDPTVHLKFLDIPRKLWLIPADKLDSEGKLIATLDEDEFPYRDAYLEMSKIGLLRTPREKLGVLLMVHSLMRSCVVDYHKGKEEVVSMDEELPLLIYILLYCQVENLPAELSFIEDYVKLDPSLESETRLMTNFKSRCQVSCQYIEKEWK